MNQQSEQEKLRLFHASHFPGQPVPDIQTQQGQSVAAGEDGNLGHPNHDIDVDLGWYEDGVKRTLSDEQIKMFRHSEIQRLLIERKALREAERKRQKKQDLQEATIDSRLRRRHLDVDDMKDGAAVETLAYDEADVDLETTKQLTGGLFQWPKLGV